MPNDVSKNEAVRRLENVVRAGTIAAVDHAAGRCRILSGGLHTNWLPWITLRAGNVRKWSPPSEGEQCLILCPGGDVASAIVLSGVFSSTSPANGDSGDVERTTYPDGAVIEYDHASHTLKATLPGGGTAEITAPVNVTVRTASLKLDALQTLITGEVQIAGNLMVVGDVSAGPISLARHVHGGVDTGQSSTDSPR